MESGVQLQLQTGFIDRIIYDGIVGQRASDGYFNATAMCRAAGKQWRDYARASGTKPFIDELSSVVRIPHSGLVQQIVGGQPDLQGTWVHPQVAVNLAQWLSPKFAVLVSKWVIEWSSGNIKQPSLPYHLRRYLVNMPNVPYGYFSMLNEVTLSLIGPLRTLKQ